MTLDDYLKVLRDRWATILATVLIAVGLTISWWLATPRSYTASITLYVSAQHTDNPQAAFQGAQLSAQRVTSYVELVKSSRITRQVVEDLRLDRTPEDVARQITASSALDSVLINVSVVDTDPILATNIVNAVGTKFPDLVSELEQPGTPGAVPPVTVRTVEPADIPAKSSSLGISSVSLLGIGAGMICGTSLAFIRNYFDRSVKSISQLQMSANAPILGSLAYDGGVPKRPLTVHEDPQSPRSEAFRQLRTNLQFVEVDKQHKVFSLSSAVASEGKTTTLANLAIALALAGQRVVVVEADLRRPTLSATFGIDRSVGLTNVLTARLRLEQVIQSWSGLLDVLSSGPLPPNPSELLGSEQMRQTLTRLRNEYDVVLVDTPPILPVSDTTAVSPFCDGVILVCRSKKTTRDQVELAVDALRSVASPVLGAILTMTPANGPNPYSTYSRSELQEHQKDHSRNNGPANTAPRRAVDVGRSTPPSSDVDPLAPPRRPPNQR